MPAAIKRELGSGNGTEIASQHLVGSDNERVGSEVIDAEEPTPGDFTTGNPTENKFNVKLIFMSYLI